MKKNLKNINDTALSRLEKHRKRAGISIVETMMALVILAVFIAGSSKILLAQRKLTDKAREHYAAINVAKNRIELCRTFEFGQMADFLERDIVVDHNGVSDTDGHFRRSTMMTPISSNMVEMVVVVEIQNRMSLNFEGEKEELKTYFTQYLSEESSVGSGVGVN